MSELKVINAYLPSFDADHNVMLLVSHTKENYAPAKQIECYTKSDADKVIAELKEERRWRKFSDEKPDDKQWIFVHVENPSKYGTYIELRRWDAGCKFDVEDQELYTKWMPLPEPPKEAK